MMTNRRLTEGYGKWVEQLEKEGYEAFLLTFMFRHIPGSAISVKKVMREAIEMVYARSLIRILRYPKSLGNRHRKPIWIVCPDYPVGKGYAKSSIQDVTVNNGRHMHAIVMIPPRSRLKDRFDLHLMAKEATYLHEPLHRIHAEPIRSRLGYVSGDYALKQVLRGRVSTDEIIILPRTEIEMAPRSTLHMSERVD